MVQSTKWNGSRQVRTFGNKRGSHVLFNTKTNKIQSSKQSRSDLVAGRSTVITKYSYKNILIELEILNIIIK